MIVIFWDYDGTLVDTETVYKNSLISFFGEKNYWLKNLTDEYFYKNIAGRHPEEFLSKLENDGFIKKNLNIDPFEVKKYYTKYFSELKKNEIKITKNIDKAIKKLSENKNILMCITSSSYKKDFNIKHSNINSEILQNLFKTEENVYLCGDIENCRFKPQPDIFEYAFKDLSQKYNITAENCKNLFIIEDSIAGCKAGHQFKEEEINLFSTTVIGYLGASVLDNSEALIENGADIIIKNAENLYKYLKSFCE